jgi:hypothetical protein
MRIVLTLLQDMDLECAGTEGSDKPRRIEIRWKDPDWASTHGSNAMKLRDAKELSDEELMGTAQEGRPELELKSSGE